MRRSLRNGKRNPMWRWFGTERAFVVHNWLTYGRELLTTVKTIRVHGRW